MTVKDANNRLTKIVLLLKKDIADHCKLKCNECILWDVYIGCMYWSLADINKKLESNLSENITKNKMEVNNEY